MGVISLFSDMTHEGAASILSAFLSLTAASAAVIGFVSGLGALFSDTSYAFIEKSAAVLCFIHEASD